MKNKYNIFYIYESGKNFQVIIDDIKNKLFLLTIIPEQFLITFDLSMGVTPTPFTWPFSKTYFG